MLRTTKRAFSSFHWQPLSETRLPSSQKFCSPKDQLCSVSRRRKYWIAWEQAFCTAKILQGSTRKWKFKETSEFSDERPRECLKMSEVMPQSSLAPSHSWPSYISSFVIFHKLLIIQFLERLRNMLSLWPWDLLKTYSTARSPVAEIEWIAMLALCKVIYLLTL